LFITYASYSHSGVKGLVDKPADRSGPVKAILEKAGGKLVALYNTTGSNDVVVVSDSGMIAPRVPTMSYGLRGVAALELTVRGPKIDLHSGIYGGAVANPATALARLLATLHDRDGRIAISGFYDEVAPLQDWEREAWARDEWDIALQNNTALQDNDNIALYRLVHDLLGGGWFVEGTYD